MAELTAINNVAIAESNSERTREHGKNSAAYRQIKALEFSKPRE